MRDILNWQFEVIEERFNVVLCRGCMYSKEQLFFDCRFSKRLWVYLDVPYPIR
jgi:hypothetical protein